MKTLENFKNEADRQSLSLMGLTGSANGYPEPDLGWFAYGFASIEEAEKFAGETGGEICLGQWRDGWGYAHYQGMTWKHLGAPSADWFGDDYRILDSEPKLEEFADFFGYASENEMIEHEEAAEVNEKKVAYEELISSCKAYADFESQVVVLCGNDYYEALNREPMSFYHDTRHLAVGVAWLWDEHEEDEEE